jgi:hypothetical protein
MRGVYQATRGGATQTMFHVKRVQRLLDRPRIRPLAGSRRGPRVPTSRSALAPFINTQPGPRDPARAPSATQRHPRGPQGLRFGGEAMLCASGCSALGKTPSARRERSDRRFERCLSTARSAPTATSQGVLAPRERSWCLRHAPGRPAARARTGTPTPHVATKQADVTALRYPSHAAQADAAARATQEGARPALAAPSEPTPSCRDPLRPLPVTLHSLSEALEPCSAGEPSISATLKAPHQKLCCSGAEPLVPPPRAVEPSRSRPPYWDPVPSCPRTH